MATSYDARAGQFRGDNGRFVPRAEVLRLVDAEVARTQTRLKGHARLLAGGKIDIAEFQTRTAEDVKLSHLRMAAFAAGGTKQLTPTHYGTAGAELKRQYKYLDGFGKAISAGTLTEKQLLARAQSYALSSRTAFFKSEKVTRGKNGFNQAKRSLDSQAQHCPSCLRYSTGGRWRYITDVIEPGVACECQSRCKCTIVYRVANLSDALPRVA